MLAKKVGDVQFSIQRIKSPADILLQIATVYGVLDISAFSAFILLGNSRASCVNRSRFLLSIPRPPW